MPNFDSAVRHLPNLEERLLARAGDKPGQGVMLNLTGIALSREARHREAAELFTQAEKLFESLADPVRVITTKINRGFEMLDIAAGESESAALVSEVEMIANEVIVQGVVGGEDGNNTGAYGHSLLSRVHAFRGSFDAALADAGYAERSRPRRRLRPAGHRDRARPTRMDDSCGRPRECCRTYGKDSCRRLFSGQPSQPRQATQLQADLLEALGDHAGALASFRQFHVLDRDLHNDEAERRSRVTMARLEVESARRETQLAQSRVTQLEALDHDKRDFLASVSHELRTPLTSVMGFATELAESWERIEAAEARNLVQVIARQSTDISNIVDDLTITRLEAGTMTVRPQAVEVAEQAASLVEMLARDSGRNIDWSGRAWVWADPTRLRQIIRNLVTNALRYGGDIVRVEVSVDEEGGFVEARDSGGPND